jgi:hypothetical protein
MRAFLSITHLQTQACDNGGGCDVIKNLSNDAVDDVIVRRGGSTVLMHAGSARPRMGMPSPLPT